MAAASFVRDIKIALFSNFILHMFLFAEILLFIYKFCALSYHGGWFCVELGLVISCACMEYVRMVRLVFALPCTDEAFPKFLWFWACDFIILFYLLFWQTHVLALEAILLTVAIVLQNVHAIFVLGDVIYD